jgi:hypothetical protein
VSEPRPSAGCFRWVRPFPPRPPPGVRGRYAKGLGAAPPMGQGRRRLPGSPPAPKPRRRARSGRPCANVGGQAKRTSGLRRRNTGRKGTAECCHDSQSARLGLHPSRKCRRWRVATHSYALCGLRNSRFHKTEVLTGPISEAHDAPAQIDKLLDEPRKWAKAWRSIRYDGA